MDSFRDSRVLRFLTWWYLATAKNENDNTLVSIPADKDQGMQTNLRALDLAIRVLCNKADTIPRRESIREFYNYLGVLT
jgi:hypothetical protein